MQGIPWFTIFCIFFIIFLFFQFQNFYRPFISICANTMITGGNSANSALLWKYRELYGSPFCAISSYFSYSSSSQNFVWPIISICVIITITGGTFAYLIIAEMQGVIRFAIIWFGRKYTFQRQGTQALRWRRRLALLLVLTLTSPWRKEHFCGPFQHHLWWGWPNQSHRKLCSEGGPDPYLPGLLLTQDCTASCNEYHLRSNPDPGRCHCSDCCRNGCSHPVPVQAVQQSPFTLFKTTISSDVSPTEKKS